MSNWHPFETPPLSDVLQKELIPNTTNTSDLRCRPADNGRPDYGDQRVDSKGPVDGTNPKMSFTTKHQEVSTMSTDSLLGVSWGVQKPLKVLIQFLVEGGLHKPPKLVDCAIYSETTVDEHVLIFLFWPTMQWQKLPQRKPKDIRFHRHLLQFNPALQTHHGRLSPTRGEPRWKWSTSRVLGGDSQPLVSERERTGERTSEGVSEFDKSRRQATTESWFSEAQSERVPTCGFC